MELMLQCYAQRSDTKETPSQDPSIPPVVLQLGGCMVDGEKGATFRHSKIHRLFILFLFYLLRWGGPDKEAG